MLQTCHGQHAQRQRPVNVLCTGVKRGAEKSKVKGHLTDEGKQEQPPDVFFHIVGMYKALHQQKTEDGKSQPPGEAQDSIQLEQRKLIQCAAGNFSLFQLRQQKASLDAGCTDVVDEHGDAGDHFERRAAEAAAGGGQKGLVHRAVPLFLSC